ncbi:uncharacterized protein LOC126428181 [Schistocerca serialis cubense]|uniref:uncharacterized protein LOC126428181 n=1 Tax=Schistocerca serialis cubense TaxID=2023355 RepID=UPI00214EEF25|nr:uncharacterized protein LOC126428181 [Schistocerca serialis cubense]
MSDRRVALAMALLHLLIASAPPSADASLVEKDSTIPLKKQAQVATIRCAHPDRLKQSSARCHPLKPAPAWSSLPALNGEKPPLGRRNGLPSGVGTHRALKRAQPSPLPRPVDTVPTLTPSPPSSASWAASPETLTSPMSASMFFASSAVAPQMGEYVGTPEDSEVISCWGEQPPDLVTAASCMESFMDLKQYCNTSAFTEQPEGELNTPIIDLTKEPNFDIPSRTVPGNDSVDYSWRLNDTMGLNDNYSIEGWKETEESDAPAEEMDRMISDNNYNNNNDDDNNNINVGRDYTASEYNQLDPARYSHDVTFGNAAMPLFTKSELAGTETYTTTTTAMTGDEVFLVVDREEVVPPVAEEVIVKNEGWPQQTGRVVESDPSPVPDDPAGPRHSAPARRRRGLKVELPVPSVSAVALQVTPGTASGDLFQSVPQDFDLMKFLLEDGMPEEVPDPLAALCRDGWVPNSSTARVAPAGEKTAPSDVKGDLPDVKNDLPLSADKGRDDRTVETDRQHDTGNLRDTDRQREKLQLVIRKTDSPDGHESPSYAVVQRPQRAASRRVLEAIKEELQDDYGEEEYLPDDSEYGDELERESGDGRRTTGRKRRAPRGTRRERTRHEPPRQRRRTVSTSSADDVPICRRYRELRDKNNEASRRSRENRKMREAEMQEQRERLERENARLKVRAEELERLVDALRKALVAAVSTSASRRSTAEAETRTED